MVYISLAREEKCVQNLTRISITLERPINNKQIAPTRKKRSRCQLSKLATVMYRVSALINLSWLLTNKVPRLSTTIFPQANKFARFLLITVQSLYVLWKPLLI